MKKIGLITNLERDKNLEYTREIIDFLSLRGCEVLPDELLSKELKIEFNPDIFSKSDFLTVLGGDGTILKAARKAAFYKIPILGINLGNLGYLAAAERADGKTAIERVLKGEYTVEERMMLEASVAGFGAHIGLNDVYIRNKQAAHMLKVRLGINDRYTDTYRGDGIIVSSPTGSTAYNLSAGGPVLKPDTSLMAITQICPHNLYARPFVISGDDKVTITAEGGGVGAVFIDGEYRLDISGGLSLEIKKSRFHTYIIKTTELDFYDILRRKMVENRNGGL